MPEFENLEAYEQPDAPPGKRILPVAPHASRQGEFQPRPRERRTAQTTVLQPAAVRLDDPVDARDMERAYRAAERVERAEERKRGIVRPSPLALLWRKILTLLPGATAKKAPVKKGERPKRRRRPRGKAGEGKPPAAKKRPTQKRARNERDAQGKRDAKPKKQARKSPRPARKRSEHAPQKADRKANPNQPPAARSTASAPATNAEDAPKRRRRNRNRSAKPKPSDPTKAQSRRED